MTAQNVGRTIAGALALVLSAASLGAQERQFVYISNVTGTTAGGRALTTIADQTTQALERLGEALRQRGLDYRDVVVSNVFLKDARHFQDMNQAYAEFGLGRRSALPRHRHGEPVVPVRDGGGRTGHRRADPKRAR